MTRHFLAFMAFNNPHSPINEAWHKNQLHRPCNSRVDSTTLSYIIFSAQIIFFFFALFPHQPLKQQQRNMTMTIWIIVWLSSNSGYITKLFLLLIKLFSNVNKPKGSKKVGSKSFRESEKHCGNKVFSTNKCRKQLIDSLSLITLWR